MQKYNIIRLTRDVEVFPNTVQPKDYDKRVSLRDYPKKEEYGSVLPKGTLLTEWHDSGRINTRTGQKSPRTFTEDMRNQGYHRKIPEDAFEVVNVYAPHWKDFEPLFKAMCHGIFSLPHFDPVWSDDAEGMTKLISNIAAAGGTGATGVSHIVLPNEFCPTPYDRNSRWARLFPNYTQGGNMSGDGLILLYDTTYGKSRTPIGGRYYMCEHEYIKQHTGREHRGDHRGHCSKCGLDMSVDSSD